MRNQLKILKGDFETRFSEVRKHEDLCRLTENPFAANEFSVREEFQMEVIEMKADSALRRLFSEKTLLDFYKVLPRETYSKLRQLGLRIFCLFGSTFLCEHTFSIMKNLKTPVRNRMTDEHLQAVLRLKVTSLQPDIDQLASCIQIQKSH